VAILCRDHAKSAARLNAIVTIAGQPEPTVKLFLTLILSALLAGFA
jgi:hypothetical protein